MKIQEYKLKSGERRYILKGAYIGVDSITGEEIRGTIRGKTKTEVRHKLDRKISEFKANGNTKIAKVNISTCNELIDIWLESYEKSGIRESSFETIRSQTRRIRPLIGDIRLEKLSSTLMHIKADEFKEKAKSEGYKKYEVILRTIKRIFQFGVSRKYLQINPMEVCSTKRDKIDLDIENTTSKIEFYDKKQIKQIFDCFEHFQNSDINDVAFATFIKILFLSGARANEILCLNWSDIDFKARNLSITKTYSSRKRLIRPPKSKAGVRTIELDETSIELLKAWKKTLYEKCLMFGITSPSLVFLNISSRNHANSYHYNHMLERYQEFCCNNNIEYLGGLHCFRHTYATMYIAAGGDFKTLQTRLGHETISMTMDLYAKALPEIERRAVDETLKFLLA